MAMYPKNMFLTSESVTEGHPDKLSDQISDAVLDECLREYPESRVACETYATMGLVTVGGEVTTTALFDVAKLVRDLSHDIGYTAPLYGFDVNTRAVVRTIHAQFQCHVQAVVRATERPKRTIEMCYGGAVWEELQQPY